MICSICGKSFKRLSMHVRVHGLTFKEYLERKEIPIENLESLHTNFEDFDSIKDLSKNIKIRYNDDPAIDNKYQIVDFLHAKFQCDIVPDFIIEIKDNFGLVSQRIVTDISIPSKKWDFEFPTSYWHNINQQFLTEAVRERILQTNGWKIFVVMAPSISEVSKSLSLINIYTKKGEEKSKV